MNGYVDEFLTPQGRRNAFRQHPDVRTMMGRTVHGQVEQAAEAIRRGHRIIPLYSPSDQRIPGHDYCTCPLGLRRDHPRALHPVLDPASAVANTTTVTAWLREAGAAITLGCVGQDGSIRLLSDVVREAQDPTPSPRLASVLNDGWPSH